MSTIMGIKTNNIVILGADKRLSTYDNKFISDDNNKILVINNHLAMACAGNAAIQKAIEIDISMLGINKDLLFVEDALDVIRDLHKKLKKADAKTILSKSSYLIIGGLNRNQEIKLFSASYVNGRLQCSEAVVDKIIYPPNDVSMQKCIEIFMENYVNNPECVIEKTVTDISDLSVVVSRCGNKWIYDNRSKQCEMQLF